MSINNISLSDLRQMNGKEGLILQGCGESAGMDRWYKQYAYLKWHTS